MDAKQVGLALHPSGDTPEPVSQKIKYCTPETMSHVTVANVSPLATFTFVGAAAGPPGFNLLQPVKQKKITTQMYRKVKSVMY
jgi:hypothetical protein